MKKWTYDLNPIHGWIIFREDTPEVDLHAHTDGAGLIGTSEWAWVEEEDLKAICKMLNDNNFISPSEEKMQDEVR